ncbi:MAG: hypothetical protein A3E78_02945 [Alphaproteobacteria bacterium RIFCSPHIGHO2_12_FULL_63_12]|nr:MAG: hypothetical protein A3E78_02945 [Alphaproteobacteria bacterium RIFCSPHIGHO2_12_FULL_63_12]
MTQINLDDDGGRDNNFQHLTIGERVYAMKKVVLIVALALAACGREPVDSAPGAVAPVEESEPAYEPSARDIALSQPPTPVFAPTPQMNARRGRILFISNGCVICHRVNGVGGLAAPDLSAVDAPDEVDPLEFSARMWRGAPAMSALQTIELGYVIELSAQNIADLAAFAASPDEQQLLVADSVSDEMRTWFVDERYWMTGEWEQYRQRGEKIPNMTIEEP